MYKTPEYRSPAHLIMIQDHLRHHPEVLLKKPTKCPECGCDDVQIGFGYDVQSLDFVTELVENIEVYYTSYDRKDVLNRVANQNNSITRIKVSKQPYRAYFSCSTNACYLGEMYLKHNPEVY